LPGNPLALNARQALEMATRGGAAVLGRDDVGYLAPGMSADFIAVNMNRLAFAGAHDPVAALLYCQSAGVDLAVVNGRIVVEGGRLATLDIEPVQCRHRELAREMVRRDA
jgi:cytosine/adenosine deaminase-related metal-dependent hydrolase